MSQDENKVDALRRVVRKERKEEGRVYAETFPILIRFVLISSFISLSGSSGSTFIVVLRVYG